MLLGSRKTLFQHLGRRLPSHNGPEGAGDLEPQIPWRGNDICRRRGSFGPGCTLERVCPPAVKNGPLKVEPRQVVVRYVRIEHLQAAWRTDHDKGRHMAGPL